MITPKNQLSQDYRKLVIVGNSMCDNQFIQTSNATISKTHVIDIQVDGQTIELALFDTADLEDYNLLRQLS
ncbi:unnamed protein product [Rotaria sp. Silwood1]|nr:unnamed protein product [Rotaria sp. Silwood1]